jgi:hypothetical protein
MKQNIVTFTLLRFEKRRNKWWAFSLMGRSTRAFKNIEGLSFVKMVGSGAGNGFSILPNLEVYGLLCVWETEAYAKDFFHDNSFFQEIKQRCSQYYCIFAENATSHGFWDGKNPFTPTVKLDENKPLAVLTRATIKLRYLPYFWKFVPRTSQSVYEQSGRIFTIGIGELPLIQQATFSLWENPAKMMEYAYKSKFHSEVVKKTRELGWYKEELFARFHPYGTIGDWNDLQLQNLPTL